jgi:uncharacterized damage-inducible protein DinB
MKLRIILFHFLLVFTISSLAQSGTALKKQLVSDWTRARTYTLEMLDLVPASGYSFRPNDSVRSFAQQMLHLAQMNISFVGLGTKMNRLWAGRDMEKTASAQSADSVRYFVNTSYAYLIDAIAQLDTISLFEMHKVGSFNYDRYTWLLKGFEHQTHHRGQCVIYLRLMGLRPPDEKLL